MFAHELINTIKKYFMNNNEPINQEYRDMLVYRMSLVEKAVKYHMGVYTKDIMKHMFSLIDGVLNKSNKHIQAFITLQKYIRLPYPTMWIDFYTDETRSLKKGILLNLKDGVLSIHGAQCPNTGWTFNPYHGTVIMNDEIVKESLNIDKNNSNYPYDVDNVLFEHAVNSVHSAYLILLYLNCKNITTIDNRPSHLLTRITNKNKRPPFTYKTLVITNVVKKYKNKKLNNNVTETTRAFHTVAGHFRYYTEENPLFGIKGRHGLFFIPDHERGNVENGVVVKDYLVVNNTENKGGI